MKKILLLVPLVLFSYLSHASIVRFSVNMTGQIVSPNGVHLAGSFGNDGYPNWNPGGIVMNDPEGDNIYEVDLNLTPSTIYQYKFVNGNSWGQDENLLPIECNVNGNRQVMTTNEFLVLPSYCWMQCAVCSGNPQLIPVTFKVDITNENYSGNEVYLAGNFGLVPTPFSYSNWVAGELLMAYSGQDDVFERTMFLPEGYTYEFKYVITNSFAGAEDNIGAPCGNGANRLITVGTSPMVLDTVCFSSCGNCVPVQQPVTVTFLVNMLNTTVSPNGVHLAGNFGSDGYPNWSPNGIQMGDGNLDGVYQVQLNLMPGQTYEYKFINGNSWASVEPSSGSCFNGSTNRFFTAPSTGLTLPQVCFGSCTNCVPQKEVTFQVDMSYMTVSPNGVHLAGSFGIAGLPEWSPNGIPMTDIDADGVYEVTLSLNEAQFYQYKFINGNDWPGAETVPNFCGVNDGFGGYNRIVSVLTDQTIDVQCFSACGLCDPGCTDISACNYNPIANADDGTCTFPTLTYYFDGDNDGFGAGFPELFCEIPQIGWSAASGDCNDSNNLVYPGAQEICGNGIDNDCDSAIDEGCTSNAPPNDSRAAAVLVSASGFPICSNLSSSLSNAGNSPEALTLEPTGAGQDVWYRFIAQTNGARIQASSAACDLVLELQNAAGTVLMASENETTTGSEILIANNLVAGQTYFVAVRNFSTSSVGSFTYCIQHLRASQPDNGNVFSSLCGFIKARWTGANVYSVSFSDGINTYSASSSSTQIPFSALPGLQYATAYQVTFSSTFNQTDAAGNPVQAVVVSPPYSVIINQHPLVELRSIDRCPTTRSVGSFVGTDIVVCGITGWEWEFLQVDANDNVLSPQVVIAPTGTSRFIRLSSVPGLIPGGYYRVRVRPVFSSGPGAFHSNYRLLCVAGSANMTVEDELLAQYRKTTINKEEFVSANVFPNPNNGELIHLMLPNGLNDVRFYDNLGRVVYQNRFVCEGEQLVSIAPYTKLESGVYHIEVIKDYQRDSFKLFVE